ncbi:BA75_02647T0 [Komagataella pastoris]|uniref:BA75_02647T0 n=1 Tax=Komagataella pastoris TaxID=4922 RepID=A0A1B2JBX2_PICPA|nr:BA75_02647T0 [Komagataella pastoris]
MGSTQIWSETKCNRVSRPFTSTILHLRGNYSFSNIDESKSIHDIERLWYRNKSDPDDPDQDYEPQRNELTDLDSSKVKFQSLLNLAPEVQQEFNSSFKKICLFFDTVYYQEPSRLQHLTSIKMGKNMLMRHIQNNLKYQNSKKRNFDELECSSDSDTDSECDEGSKGSDNLKFDNLLYLNNSISALYNRWILFGFGLEFMADNINHLVPILWHVVDYFVERKMWYAARWLFKAALKNIDSFVFWKLFNQIRDFLPSVHFRNESILYNSCVNKLNSLSDLYYFIENRCWTVIESKPVYMEIIFQTVNVVLRDLKLKGFSQDILSYMLDDYFKMYGTVDDSTFLNGVYVLLIIHKYHKVSKSNQYRALKAVSKSLKLSSAREDTHYGKIYIDNKIMFRWLSFNMQLFNDIAPSLDSRSLLNIQKYLATRPKDYAHMLTEIRSILDTRTAKQMINVTSKIKSPVRPNSAHTRFRDNICLLRSSEI